MNRSAGFLPLGKRAFLRVKRLQAVCAGAILLWGGVHAANAAAAGMSPELGERMLETVRGVTGRLVLEILCLGLPFALHAGCGILLVLHEGALRRQGEQRLAELRPSAQPGPRGRVLSARLHRLTGLLLVPLLFVHLAWLRFAAGEPSGYARVSHILRQSPILGRSCLLLLALVLVWHAQYGAWMAAVNLGILGPGRPRRIGRVATAVAAAAMGVAFVFAIARL